MYNATEQLAEINKAGYDNAVKLAELSLEKAERLTKLNWQAAKVALEQGVYSANAVAGIKDVQEFVTVRAKITEAGVQNALGYSRGVYQIASEAQADFSALAEQAWAAYTKGVAAWVEKAARLGARSGRQRGQCGQGQHHHQGPQGSVSRLNRNLKAEGGPQHR